MTRIGIVQAMIAGLALLQAGETGKDFKQTAIEQKVFESTNQERKKKDLAPLKLSAALSKVARAHSANMAKQEKLDHVLDDKNPLDRMRDAGYKFMKGAENIAYGDEEITLATIMKAWMESKAHADNILSPDYTEIGIGIAKDKSGTLYYTQVFAKPRK